MGWPPLYVPGILRGARHERLMEEPSALRTCFLEEAEAEADAGAAQALLGGAGLRRLLLRLLCEPGRSTLTAPNGADLHVSDDDLSEAALARDGAAYPGRFTFDELDDWWSGLGRDVWAAQLAVSRPEGEDLVRAYPALCGTGC
jgi:hypothetical protein